jgi:hypothetical protein
LPPPCADALPRLPLGLQHPNVTVAREVVLVPGTRRRQINRPYGFSKILKIKNTF